MKKNIFRRVFRLNFFAVTGALAGLAAAILFLTLGFWRTMLIIVLTGGGMFAGIQLDKGEKLRPFVENILPNEEKNGEDDI